VLPNLRLSVVIDCRVEDYRLSFVLLVVLPRRLLCGPGYTPILLYLFTLLLIAMYTFFSVVNLLENYLHILATNLSPKRESIVQSED